MNFVIVWQFTTGHIAAILSSVVLVVISSCYLLICLFTTTTAGTVNYEQNFRVKILKKRFRPEI